MNLLNKYLVELSTLILLCIYIEVECSLSDEQYKNPTNLIVHKHEQSIKENLSLEQRLLIEKSTFHWYPYQRINLQVMENGTVEEEECIPRDSSIDEFPQDLFSQNERTKGAVLLHLFAAVYFFVGLAIICDRYFLPAVECICEDLGISENVAAATFMATATSMPEFFTNSISVFVAKSDMGLGTIIGSMLFNTLGVAAAASLAAPKPILIEWWPVTRDSIINSWNLIVLVAVAWDGRIEWYETIILMVFYFLYFIIMFLNPQIFKVVKKVIDNRCFCCKTHKLEISGNSLNETVRTEKDEHFENLKQVSIISDKSSNQITNGLGFKGQIPINGLKLIDSIPSDTQSHSEEVENFSLWKIPDNASKKRIFWHFFTFPISFFLFYLMPNPKNNRKLYPLTFILCMLTIGSCSYLVFWMVVIIGHTFGIPEPVMGLTFLAAGGCTPEAISAILVAKSGSGKMGISNALGANSLNILFSLGVPWFIRTMIDGAGSTGAYINIVSYGVEFVITSLLLALLCLFVVLFLFKFTLRKSVGVILFGIYGLFVVFAILMEFDVFFDSGRCSVF